MLKGVIFPFLFSSAWAQSQAVQCIPVIGFAEHLEVTTIFCMGTELSCALHHSHWFAEQGPSDNTVPLLQLPHFDQDLLKRLNRKRVKALQDLFCMPAHERREVYGFGGE